MTHADNKVDWCLKKAEKEFKEEGKHRGLLKVEASKEKALAHLDKAEHYFSATKYLKEGGFSDISASAGFYAMYHCLLAIAVKQGYQSGNQECTFALIKSLIEEKKIDFDIKILEKITSFEAQDKTETIVDLREQYQYGTSLSLNAHIYQELLELSQKVITATKKIIL